jgi:hypothetical protein
VLRLRIVSKPQRELDDGIEPCVLTGKVVPGDYRGLRDAVSAWHMRVGKASWTKRLWCNAIRDVVDVPGAPS